MRFFESLAIGVSMYSKIPMPRVEWNEKNMKYAMCFFPLVGVVTGILEVILGNALLVYTSCGTLFFAGVMTLLPVLVNGGIHMDGFLDTMDALNSYGSREKKLEILKDSRTGAFAVIGFGLYLVASLALWSEAKSEMLPVIGAGYVMSRSLSGLSVMVFPSAKKDGLGRTFQEQAHRKRVAVVMVCWFFAALADGRGGSLHRSSGILVLPSHGDETVWRDDRRSGRIFSAACRTFDTGSSDRRRRCIMRIWLIRHFRTQGNLERRYIGGTDEPILPGQTGNILCCPEKIITSPMLRCKQTARLLFQKEPDLICENFREKDFGRFEGKNYEELKDDPGYQRWLDSNGTIPFPEGEGQEAFLERTRHGFEQMMEHLMDLQCREAAFVVHGGTIMAVLSAFSQTGGDFYDWQVSNGSGYSAIAEEESWRQGKKQLTEIEKL